MSIFGKKTKPKRCFLKTPLIMFINPALAWTHQSEIARAQKMYKEFLKGAFNRSRLTKLS